MKLKKYLKISRNLILVLLSLCILFLVICFSYNKLELKKEAKIIKPTGSIVKVNGRNMHVYTEGSGDLTCVFMSGSAVAASNLDFKGLYGKLSNKYRIAVVDRASYGFSDTANDSRDIDTILDETRQALKKAGINGPYILFPHSISGLEAIYWAQKYPSEVKGLIGLDIGLPEEYANQTLKKSDLLFLDFSYFLAKVGVYRFLPSIAYDKTIVNGNFLSENEKELYKALCYKNLYTSDMVKEIKFSQSNSKKSTALDLPVDTPILIFAAFPYTNSEAKKRNISVESYDEHYTKYVSKFKNGKVISVPGKHCIYLYAPDTISVESTKFIDSIKN